MRLSLGHAGCCCGALGGQPTDWDTVWQLTPSVAARRARLVCDGRGRRRTRPRLCPQVVLHYNWELRRFLGAPTLKQHATALLWLRSERQAARKFAICV